MAVTILLFVFMGILCATTCFGKMSACSRKYQFLGCIQTNGTEVKLNSKYFFFFLWGWYFCKFQAAMDQFFLCVNTSTVIPCSPAGRLEACGSSMCCKGWIEYSWGCVNVCAGTCKQTLYRPMSEVAMQPKLSDLLLLSIKEQSEVSPCLPVLSVCHWISNFLPKSVGWFLFSLVFVGALFCFRGGKHLFLTASIVNILLQSKNSFLHGKLP